MFASLIEKRRSIRKYEDRKIETQKVELLLEAALRAPSSMNRTPWEFILVEEEEKLENLSQAKPHGASFLKNAPMAIVVCADPAKSDVWIEDASIAAIFIQLAAEDMDLGSCWIQMRERMHDRDRSAGQYVKEQLGIPENMEVLCMVALGYPAEQKAPHGKDELLFHNVHRGAF